jgi:glycosyltransferase involved in cell wall biosynthesis
MRIVIDLQGAQTPRLATRQISWNPDSDHFSLAFSWALVKEAREYANEYANEHEILIVLNGLFPERIEPIRAAFEGLLPQENIRVWEAPSPLAASAPENAQRRDRAERIRETFLATLKPDIVLITSQFEGFQDKAVTRIEKQVFLPTAVVLHEFPPEDASWRMEKLAQLRSAGLLLATSAAVLDAARSAGFSEEFIIPLFEQESQNHDPEQVTQDNCAEYAKRALAALVAWRADAALPDVLSPLSPFPQPEKRPRLAYISPLPPEASGISDYSAELLPVLSRWYEIDVIVEQAEVSDPWIQAHCPIRSVEWFRAHADVFERVLYHFGNSQFHRHMFGLLEEIPGVVVLHDFFLSGIQASRELFGWGAPHSWIQALYDSHGYQAVLANHTNKPATVEHYPANLPVLQAALGVIVHSEYSRSLLARWYDKNVAASWTVLPHLRVAALNMERENADENVPESARESARHALDLAPEDFLVCTFGLLGPIKQNDRLLNAWMLSPLAKDPHAMLVFAGENDPGDYGRQISQAIKATGMKQRIRITGRLSMQDFRYYLAAADIGVQLRTKSRGETSGTVLDCMNYSLPTIANAHGSLVDLDPTGVWLLPDEFKDHELADALTTLWRDPERRRNLGQQARKIVETRHQPEHCARRYAEAVEGYYRTSAGGQLHALLSGLGRGVAEPEMTELAVALARNFPPTPKKRHLFVDVSALVEVDLRTGIQRVVRAILREWLDRVDDEWQVEPVYASTNGYRHARRFTSHFLGIPDEWADDVPVEAWAGDIFFGLDFHNMAAPTQRTVLEQWRNKGVVIGFLVYDLLPVSHPECFPEGTFQIHQRWLETICALDFAIGISRSVAEDLQHWLVSSEQVKRQRPFRIEWSHIGADLGASVPTRGIPPDGTEQLRLLRARPSFLMVGTIEPRKGHGEVLEAFERLWADGKEINLVIVGKNGWMQDALIQRLRNRMTQEPRLIWLEGISDEYLESVYAASVCLIAASRAEGFGLPLIEAARHKLPVIARDIPVFREVAGQHAYYFTDDLAHSIETWLALHAQNQHPGSDEMPWLSWQESAERLWNLVTAVS